MIVYKIVRDKEEGYLSLNCYLANPLKYEIGKETKPNYGPIFAWKDSNHALLPNTLILECEAEPYMGKIYRIMPIYTNENGWMKAFWNGDGEESIDPTYYYPYIAFCSSVIPRRKLWFGVL